MGASMEKLTINTKNGPFEMEKDTFIRWLCLVEIIEKTEEKAKDLKIDLDEYDWVKPVDFKKYIKARFKGMEIDLEHEEKNSFSNTHHIQEYRSQTYQKQIS